MAKSSFKIQDNPFFQLLQPSDISLLEQEGEYISLAKGDKIKMNNFNWQFIYFILEGNLRVYYLKEDGQVQVMFLPSEKEVITGAPENLLERHTKRYIFEANTDTELFGIALSQLETLSNQSESLSQFYISVLKWAIFTVFTRLDKIISLEVADRFEDLILERPHTVKNNMRKDIAQFLGVTPNSLSRALSYKAKKNKRDEK